MRSDDSERRRKRTSATDRQRAGRRNSSSSADKIKISDKSEVKKVRKNKLDENKKNPPKKIRIQKNKKRKRKENINIEPKEKVVFYKNKKFWKIVLICFLAVCLIGGIAGVTVGIVWMAQAPELDTSKFEYISTSTIYDNEGNYYQELQGEENRVPKSIDEIPEIVQLAFVAVEDQRFYQHNGIDIIGTTKAIFNVLFSGSLDGPGGSTITQQLIKQTHLTSEKQVKRKVQEWYLAYQCEQELSKEKILEAYLNKVNLSQAWGVEAGAKFFFGKSCDEISISQAAVLASIVNAPTYYNPLLYEQREDGEYYLVTTTDANGNTVVGYDENNKNRALGIVSKMYELNFISEEEYNIAKDELENNKIGLVKPSSSSRIYSYFTDAIYSQLVDDVMEKYKYTREDASTYILNSGLKIYSTVDKDVQSAMESTAKNDKLFPSQSSSAKKASSAVTKQTGEEINYIPQVAMTVIDNNTGAVVGILGGRDKDGNLTMNRALQKFQTGSSTKPLTVYAPGVDSGAITMATAFDDTKISVGGWKPGNAGGYKGMITCRRGLLGSVNTIAVQAFMTMGVETSVAYADLLGLDIVKTGDATDLNPAALALGGYTEGQTTLAMASAFSTFPNMGVRKEPYFYTSVVDSKGDVILEHKDKETRVFQEGTAYIITDVLKGVVRGGTTSVSIPDTQVAGKTGTTDNQRHAWFCGYTKDYTAAVWYGYDKNEIYVNGTKYTLNIGVYGGGSRGPARFWQTVMRKVYKAKDLGTTKFAGKPDDVYSASVDGVSGKSPSELSAKDPRGSRVYSELFLEGTGPDGVDDIHVEVTICNKSGKIANEYCPNTTTKVMLLLTEDRFPAGVTEANRKYSPSGQNKYRIDSLDNPEDICSTHNANSISGIDFYSSGGTLLTSYTMTGNEKLALTVRSSSAMGETQASGVSYSVSGNAVTYKVSGNSIILTGVKNGSVTVSASVTDSSGEHITKSITINVSGFTTEPTIPEGGEGNGGT